MNLFQFQHNSNKIAIIALVGELASILIFFLGLQISDSLVGFQLLIFPFTILLGVFFIGYGFKGTIKGALKDMVIILALIFLYVLFTKIPINF